MIVSIIAAMAENRVIGAAGRIPWDLPADRRRFRELTMEHPLIMGRKTFESIGRPLDGRKTIVVTSRPGYRAAACQVVPDLAAALSACAADGEVFVCGGEEVYREAITVAARIYLTVIHREFPGDVFFPPIPDSFAVVSREEVPGALPCSFLRFERGTEDAGKP